jgi:hypothetical protein
LTTPDDASISSGKGLNEVGSRQSLNDVSFAHGSGECCLRVEEARERGKGLRPGAGVAVSSRADAGGGAWGAESAHTFHSAAGLVPADLSAVSQSPKPSSLLSVAHGDCVGDVLPKNALGGGLSSILGGEGGASLETGSGSGVAHGEPHGSSIVGEVQCSCWVAACL